MNILILTSRFGMGHLKCAEAVREKILMSSPDANVEIVDLIEQLFPKFYGRIYSGYRLIAGFSGMYNYLNRFAANVGGIPLKKRVLRTMGGLFRRFKPDLVISCFSACSTYFSEYKRVSGLKVPLYTYITDVPVHALWVTNETDLYFVADKSSAEGLKNLGVPPERIRVSGVPVSSAFSDFAVTVGRRTFKLEAPGASSGSIVVMGGGLGMIPGGRAMLRALERVGESGSVRICVIAGNNKKLEEKIQGRHSNIEVVGYTERVAEYMKAADLLITKPGGSTLFEAIHAGVPLFVPGPKLVQEKGNAAYIEEKRIGKVMCKRKMLESASLEREIRELIGDETARREMSYRMKCLCENFSSGDPLEAFEERSAA